MAKFKPDSLEFLLQLDLISPEPPTIIKDQWQTLYLADDEPSHRFAISCGHLDGNAAKRAMRRDGWDLNIGSYRPGFKQRWSNGEEITTYHCLGDDDGARPIVLHRYFHGAFPKYLEVDVEFRLYHDLAEDKARGLLLDFDESGREIEVVRIKPKEVRAKLKYLRQFQVVLD